MTFIGGRGNGCWSVVDQWSVSRSVSRAPPRPLYRYLRTRERKRVARTFCQGRYNLCTLFYVLVFCVTRSAGQWSVNWSVNWSVSGRSKISSFTKGFQETTHLGSTYIAMIIYLPRPRPSSSRAHIVS